MPIIRIIDRPDDTPFEQTRDLVDEEMRAKLSAGELGTAVRFFHPGSPTELQMFEMMVPPDALIDQHAHDEDEIIYVVEGELHLGRRVLASGASVHIPGNTLYSFRAGPAGLRFLNFRAHQDNTYLTRDEFVVRRSASAAPR